MTVTDMNVVLAFLVISLVLAGLLVLVDPKASGWLGRRLWAHSCAQTQARRAYRAEIERLMNSPMEGEV